MRTWLKLGVIAVAIAGMSVLVPRGALAVISGTSHDFSSAAPGGQLCVACHAPHHVPGTLLLWNHVLSGNIFSWSDATATSSGTTLPTNINTWSGSTKNCLACHDGTVELGAIIDPPTSFDATKMTGPAQIVTTTGDMKGNHPVAVPYPYNQTANTYNGITDSGVTFTGYAAAPSKVKVFTDSSVAAPNNRGIECASCHDPHGTSFSLFLRDDTVGSAICLNCHLK